MSVRISIDQYDLIKPVRTFELLANCTQYIAEYRKRHVQPGNLLSLVVRGAIMVNREFQIDGFKP